MAASILRSAGAYRTSARLDRAECSVGERISAHAAAPRRFRPPAVIVRYEMALGTADGRELRFLVDPESGAPATLEAACRGAFRAASDELSARDAFGFFVARRSVPAEEGPRLLVLPAALRFPFERQPRAGGEAFREEPTFRRTDELTESRKYLPGDDPRRINWKLYGHSGELFVREGEPEPPPRARYAVVVDSSVDPSIYGTEAGAAAVDHLAEAAFGLCVDLLDAGLEVEFGAAGLRPASGGVKDAARFFASVAALALDSAAELRGSEDPGTRTVVLALPRSVGAAAQAGPLDRFLAGRSAVSSPVDILFAAGSAAGSAADDAGSAAAAARRAGRTGTAGWPAWRALFFADAVPVRSSPDAAELRSLADECVRAFAGKGGARARLLEA